MPTDDGKELIFSGSNQPLLAELEHFIHCIQTRETPISGSANALAVIKVLEQAQIQLENR